MLFRLVERRSIFLFVGKISVSILIVIILLVPIEIFAVGTPSPNFYLDVTPRTQKVNAGGSTIYGLGIYAEWTGWFNLTVGSTTTTEQDLLVDPLPKGVEANFTEALFIDDQWKSYSIPLEIIVSPDIEHPMINLTVVVSGLYNRSGEFYNRTFINTRDILLYVVPKETSLGEASTVFFEGFDESSAGWNMIADGGTVGLSDRTYINKVPTKHLILNDWSFSKSVTAERTIPLLNNSFILEFEFKSRKSYLFQLKFELQNSTQGGVLSAELTDGNILVQNISYGQFETFHWYNFRFEVDSDRQMFKWFLDDKYMDTLPWRGSPNKIWISTSDSEIGVGLIDDIFIQEILEIPDTTITITETKTSTTTTTITSTTNIINTLTVPFIISTTTTVTSWGEPKIVAASEENTVEPIAYLWVIVPAIIITLLSVIVIFRKRR